MSSQKQPSLAELSAPIPAVPTSPWRLVFPSNSDKETRSGAFQFLRALLVHPNFSPLCDLSSALLAFYSAFWLRATVHMPATQGLLPMDRLHTFKDYALFFAGLQLLLFATMHLHVFHRHTMLKDVATKLAAAVLLECLLAGGILYLLKVLIYPVSVICVYGILNWGLCLTWRALRRAVIQRGPARLLIIGQPDVTRELCQKAVEGGWTSPERATQVDSGAPEAQAALAAFIRQGGSAEVLIGASGMVERDWMDLLYTVDGKVDQIYVTLSNTGALLGEPRIRMLADVPVLETECPLNDPVRRVLKRFVDVACSLSLLVILSPFLLAVGLLILVIEGRPVIYLQNRMGWGGAVFGVIKFRTMRPDAEKDTGPVLSQAGDDRVTPIGRVLRRFRIDELPQLWNVLKGDMSLVGPRPERPEIIRKLEHEIPGYHLRHKVRPGITGLAQIWGRYNTQPRNKLKLDIRYIYNYSMWLDVQVLLQTVWVVFFKHL